MTILTKPHALVREATHATAKVAGAENGVLESPMTCDTGGQGNSNLTANRLRNPQFESRENQRV